MFHRLPCYHLFCWLVLCREQLCGFLKACNLLFVLHNCSGPWLIFRECFFPGICTRRWRQFRSCPEMLVSWDTYSCCPWFCATRSIVPKSFTVWGNSKPFVWDVRFQSEWCCFKYASRPTMGGCWPFYAFVGQELWHWKWCCHWGAVKTLNRFVNLSPQPCIHPK